MITSKSTEEIIVNKEKLLRYRFFEVPDNAGEDAIYGLERTMINLVNVLKSACARYGTERRVLLLHGPVGSSKRRSRGRSRRGWSATRALRKGGSSASAGRRIGPAMRRRSPSARCMKSHCT